MPCTRKRAPSSPPPRQLGGLLLEHADELGADRLALGLGLGDALRACSRKRSSASTATSGTLKVSRKVLITCSPSSLRIRPWSTNTHVSWSPTARCTSSAATEESTPPERPQMTLPSPTCSRMRAICSSTIEAADQVRLAAADLGRGSGSGSPGRRGCGRPRGGTGCRRSPRSRSSTAATGEAVEEASAVKPGRRARRRCRGGTSSRSARAAARASSTPRLARPCRSERPNSPTSACSTRPPSVVHEQLHAVADAQHRDAQLEQPARRARGARPRTPRRARRRG